ncbi:unnamed protein product, partial [Cercopithifilaria johnstoni]
MHDPMAMRPFMALLTLCNHTKSHEDKERPVIKEYLPFVGNGEQSTLLWVIIYGVIEWIIRRLDGDESIGQKSAIGIVPKEGSLNLEGLRDVNIKELLSIPKQYRVEADYIRILIVNYLE